MVRTNKLHLALMNLNGEVSSEIVFGYFEKTAALEILKSMTGENFGYDVEAWRKWIQENRPGTLPEEDREPNYPPYSRHLFKKSDLVHPLEIAYRNYLDSDLNPVAAETLVTILEQHGLETESYALKTYLVEGASSKCSLKAWRNRPCTISFDLPKNAESGDLWFDPVELNLSILIPNPEGISHHVKSWVSTHPVYVWQYRVFLDLVKIGKKLDGGATPADYLSPSRVKSQDSQAYIINLYQDEAIAYSSWMQKSLCGKSNLKAMRAYLDSQELSSILPNTLKLWESSEFQEAYRMAVGYSNLDKNPSLDYDAITEENYSELEKLPDRMLYEEWDCRNNIGMLTVVPVFIGIGQESTAESLHYEFLNISPRPVLSITS